MCVCAGAKLEEAPTNMNTKFKNYMHATVCDSVCFSAMRVFMRACLCGQAINLKA